ncbi:MAG: signal peptidase I [Chloroflexi bacterium]|nr:signal peptidase I [Chloroflexota bacterium]
MAGIVSPCVLEKETHIATILNIPMLGTLSRLLTSGMYVVRGDSMAPALQERDGLLASRVDYLASPPARGDIVIVREVPLGGRRTIKRIVGLPGEEVRFADSILFISGEPFDEPYLHGQPHTRGLEEQSWTLGDAEYFVLGDNRLHSTDSRTHGPTHRSRIIGKAWFRYWPLSRWGSPV